MRHATAAVWGNRDLRELVLGALGWGLAEMATWVAVLVVAYDAGGPAATGIAIAVQLLPAGVAAPIGGVLGDRWRRSSVLTASYAVGAALAVGAAFAVAESESLVLLLALAAGLSVVFAILRPTQMSLVPQLAATPTEASAANAALGLASAVAYAVGPLLAAVLLGVGPSLVFGVSAIVMGLGAVAVRSLGRHANPTLLAESAALQSLRDLLATRGARPILALTAVFNLTVGALDVLIVALAVDALGIGDQGVGVLAGAIGVGAMAGSSIVLGLSGRRRLTPVLVGAGLAWGVSIALLGVVPGVVVGVVVLVVNGTAGMGIEVTGQTLLQRVAPPHVMSGAFGFSEGLRLGTMAVGSLLAGAAVSWMGLAGAAAVFGLLVPIAVLAFRPTGSHVDDGLGAAWEAVLMIGESPLFSALSVREREALAGSAHEREVPAGETIIVEGDAGDAAYLVIDGTLSVVKSGVEVARVGPGDHVGEIALLQDRPRTASVTAVTHARLLVIDRFSFVCVVAGSRMATRGIDADVERRLGELGDR
jgi:MFS family permease